MIMFLMMMMMMMMMTMMAVVELLLLLLVTKQVKCLMFVHSMVCFFSLCFSILPFPFGLSIRSKRLQTPSSHQDGLPSLAPRVCTGVISMLQLLVGPVHLVFFFFFFFYYTPFDSEHLGNHDFLTFRRFGSCFESAQNRHIYINMGSMYAKRVQVA